MAQQCLTWTELWDSCFAGLDKPVTDAALEFNMRPVNYGMYSTLALTCGFAPATPPEAPDSEAGPAWRFAIALWSNLPADLPVAAVEVRTPAQVFC